MSGEETREPRKRGGAGATGEAWALKLSGRFYGTVAVVETDGGFEVVLDERPVRTPLKNPLVLATRPLCEAVAAEWDAQDEHVDPGAMPLTRLANTALDRVAPQPDAVIGQVVAYAGNDLLCYRAEGPDSLILRQVRHWDPILAWAESRIGEKFVLAEGVMHHDQPAGTLAAFDRLMRGHDAFTLTAIHNAATLTGSALIAAALAANAFSADAGWAAAHADEDWQIGQWGRDEEAEARRRRRRVEFDAVIRFMTLAGA